MTVQSCTFTLHCMSQSVTFKVTYTIYIPIPKHVAESVKRTKKPSPAEPKRQKQNRLFLLKMNQKFTKKCASII